MSGALRLGSVRALTVLVVLALAAAGCAHGAAPEADAAGGSAASEVVVFAAASLTDALREVDGAFTEQHPGVTPRLNLAGSQQLATQIAQGAPADVFVSANPAQMDAVVARGLVVGDPQPVATNRLAIAVEAGNPRGIATLGDLARQDVSVVLGAPEVPAGRYAREVLDRAGVSLHPVSLEPDVRSVLGKVRLGEADAAIVYRSDLVDAGPHVAAVTIPDDANVLASYPAARLADAPHPAAAAAYLDFLRSPTAQQILGRHGFGPPAPV